jgi:hypothetical protein
MSLGFELKLLLSRDVLDRSLGDVTTLLWVFTPRGCLLGGGARSANGTFFVTRGGFCGPKHALAGDKKLVVIHILLQVAPFFMVSIFD